MTGELIAAAVGYLGVISLVTVGILAQLEARPRRLRKLDAEEDR